MTLPDAVDTRVSELKVAGVTNDWADRCRGYVHEAVAACEGNKLSDLTRASALRWSEMGGIRVRDVYLDAATPVLVIPPAVAKNRVRQLVPIHPRLVPTLAEMIDRAKGNMDATIIPRHPEPRFLDKLMEGGGRAEPSRHCRYFSTIADFHAPTGKWA